MQAQCMSLVTFPAHGASNDRRPAARRCRALEALLCHSRGKRTLIPVAHQRGSPGDFAAQTIPALPNRLIESHIHDKP
jgi:hypothetical protein